MTGSRSWLSGPCVQVCSSQEYSDCLCCVHQASEPGIQCCCSICSFLCCFDQWESGPEGIFACLAASEASLVEACVDGSQLIITYFGETDFFCSIL